MGTKSHQEPGPIQQPPSQWSFSPHPKLPALHTWPTDSSQGQGDREVGQQVPSTRFREPGSSLPSSPPFEGLWRSHFTSLTSHFLLSCYMGLICARVVLSPFFRLGHRDSEERNEVMEAGSLVPGAEMLLIPVLKLSIMITSCLWS